MKSKSTLSVFVRVFVLLGATSGLLAGCASREFYDFVPSEREIPGGSDTQGSEGPVPPAYSFNPTDTSCGGYPRLRIETMPGICVGLVHSDTTPLFQPRVIVELPNRPGEFLFTDFAGWSETAGKIWYIRGGQPMAQTKPVLVLKNLSLVHQIIAGPGGRIYFSEDHSIKSFAATAVQNGRALLPSEVQTVVSGLPPMIENGKKSSMHPLKNFVFDGAGNMYVNVGAYTDHCKDFLGKNCDESNITRGASSNVLFHGAVIRKYAFKGTIAAGWDKNYSVVARGLRNSMGMLFTSGGDLLQVENSRDFEDAGRPFEEVNLIPRSALNGSAAPKHYGWPYCYDYASKSDEWRSFTWNGTQDFCNSAKNSLYVPPFILLPPHGAPLGFIKYTGKLIPELTYKYLVALHGYRDAGHRIVALEIDSTTDLPVRKGTGSYREDVQGAGANFIERSFPPSPASTDFVDVVSGWFKSTGIRPKGAPVQLTQARDGSIWLADDKNHTILRIAAAGSGAGPVQPVVRANTAQAYTDVIKESPRFDRAYQNALQKVFQAKQCLGCHDSFVSPSDTVSDGYQQLRYVVNLGTWLVPAKPQESILFTKISSGAMPPVERPFDNSAQRQAVLDAVQELVQVMPPESSLFKVKLGRNPEIIGLRRGRPGNGKCGTVPAGRYVYVLSRSPQILGGRPRHEILVGSPSSFADLSTCSGFNAFYVNAEDLEPMLGSG